MDRSETARALAIVEAGERAAKLTPPVWSVADRVRKIRRGTGLTQTAFAEAVEVPLGTLKSWEAAATEPKRSDLLLLAVRCQRMYEVPAWWTLGLDGPQDPADSPDPRWRATVAEIHELAAIERSLRPVNSACSPRRLALAVAA